MHMMCGHTDWANPKQTPLAGEERKEYGYAQPVHTDLGPEN
jgi:hypothetical protein